MRKLLISTATLVIILGAPTIANAQAGTATGIVIGAGTGALIAGPPGAIVGGIIGAGVGASTETRVYYDDPRPYPARRCWRDEWGRRVCR